MEPTSTREPQMEFSPDPRLQRAAGVIAGAIALTSLLMCVTVAEGGGTLFLALLAAALALVAGAAFSARHTVRVDVGKAAVHVALGTLNLDWSRRYPLGDFRAVGIVSGGRSSASGGATAVYWVQLIGKRNLKLPGGSSDRREIVSVAREVAEFAALPLIEEPRIGFFGARL